MPLSLRWRLTLWNTAALAVVLLGFAALAAGLLTQARRRADAALKARIDRGRERIDALLSARLRDLQRDEKLPSDPDGRVRHWVHECKEHDNLCAVVFDAACRPRWRTEEMAADSVPAAPPEGPGPTDLHLPLLGHQRALLGPFRLPDGQYTVLVLAPREELDREEEEVAAERAELGREMNRFLFALGLAVPAALGLCGGLGYLLARKSLAPVGQLHRLTAEITADRLDRRLPVANPGDELGRLADTINAMIARLERSFAEVRRFTADASHELRTPLTAIRTETEVALRRPMEAAEYQHLLGSILEECERLTRLTEQLLALSREDAGAAAAVREPVDLAVLAAGVAETLRPLAEAKGLRLTASGDGPLFVWGDPARLRQVLVNLLDNAIKYTAEGGSVAAEWRRADSEAVVTVRDTGVGIPAEHLPHVFERFYRVDKARSRAEGGTGLGLSIVHSIVAAHGGRVELTSVPGQGTTCTVHLPAGSDSPASPPGGGGRPR